MAITHIVMFGFKADVAPDTVKDVCTHLLSLKDNCLHPTSQKPYIKSAIGGRDNSPEGIQRGITHAFVVEFDNEADREYYIQKDPAHLAFIERVKQVAETAQAVDFVPGVY
ncbi:dabb-domain-containing protein [Saccharata proteae CBS 121410]|uniref:Dabb-domain-containing protein n=1 Tax=Saccharata proteae CBS 121410 TaxID=1314787 RepID=A0A6A5YDK2_9PEZI|nr:dabb-domain-containing protein [Saccharata proteae CBS 121410]